MTFTQYFLRHIISYDHDYYKKKKKIKGHADMDTLFFYFVFLVAFHKFLFTET